MKFTVPCLLTLQTLHTKFGYDWPSSSWEENDNGRRTMHLARRRTPTHSNRSPEWLRWPKNILCIYWPTFVCNTTRADVTKEVTWLCSVTVTGAVDRCCHGNSSPVSAEYWVSVWHSPLDTVAIWTLAWIWDFSDDPIRSQKVVVLVTIISTTQTWQSIHSVKVSNRPY